jgi:sigma-54 dependent transcriptional regulator, acetoin dehydrogenase operon transcriptional activator AcoR
MTRIDEQTRRLLNQRDRYLETGQAGPGVRPEVAASWLRSMTYSIDPGGVRPDFKKMNSDRLSAAALPVIEHSLQGLSGTITSVLFADECGRLVGRWAEDSSLRNALSRSYVEAGFKLSESVVGANGVGTALETGKIAEFRGPEHFSAQFLPFTCVGAPIRHPITRRIVGAIDFTCRYEDTTSIARSWIATLARQIEQQMLDDASVRERMLLSSFITASRRTKHPVMCLNDKLVISSPATSGLLGEFDQQAIWEAAQRICSATPAGSASVTVTGGHQLMIRCRAVRDEGRLVGAVVELHAAEEIVDVGNEDWTGATAGRRSETIFPGLVGRSTRWVALCAEARRALQANDSIVVTGEPGTGKLALLKAMFASEVPVSVLDCSLESIDGVRAWVGRLRDRMQNPDGLIILSHLEAFSVQAARAVCSLLDGRMADAPRIAATLTTGGDAASSHGPLLDRLGVIRLTAPPLRERSEDVADLVKSLTQRHSAGPFDRKWLAEAVTVLSRQRWPGNIRELESIVRRTLNGHPSGHIGLADLPDEIRSRTDSRRTLSQLELLERQEIIETLKAVGGNKVRAAERLNLARSTLYRKISAFGISGA